MLKLKKSIIIFFILCIAFSAHTKEHVSAAGEYLGGKWSAKNVYWYTSSQVPISYHTPISSASNKWNGIANISLQNYFENINQTDSYQIVIRKSDDEAYWASRGYYAFGLPGPNPESGIYTKGTLEIVFLTSDKLSSADKTRMITHEWGHLLGLAHVNKLFTDSVMDESDVFKLSNPTSYDKTNLKNLYK